MSSPTRTLRPLLAIATFALALAPIQLGASIIPVTYQFTGVCSDCSGTGIGSLTLSGYTLGDTLMASNFVSFSYHSNLFDIAISSSSELQSIGGALVGPLPAANFVNIQGTAPNTTFLSTGNGFWCGGSSQTCGNDFGFTNSWASAVPEPATFLPLAGALILLGRARRRRRAR